MDLCGPLPVPTPEGYKYIATFLDDYSRLSVVELLRSKDEATNTVKSVLVFLETQCDGKVRRIRTVVQHVQTMEGSMLIAPSVRG